MNRTDSTCDDVWRRHICSLI